MYYYIVWLLRNFYLLSWLSFLEILLSWLMYVVPHVKRHRYSIMSLLKAIIRNCDKFEIIATGKDVEKIIDWETVRQSKLKFHSSQPMILSRIDCNRFFFAHVQLLWIEYAWAGNIPLNSFWFQLSCNWNSTFLSYLKCTYREFP